MAGDALLDDALEGLALPPEEQVIFIVKCLTSSVFIEIPSQFRTSDFRTCFKQV